MQTETGFRIESETGLDKSNMRPKSTAVHHSWFVGNRQHATSN